MKFPLRFRVAYLLSERAEVEEWEHPSSSGASASMTHSHFSCSFVSFVDWITSLIDKTCLPMLEHSNLRRRGRVVDCGGLENRYTLTGIVGSNPTASAK